MTSTGTLVASKKGSDSASGALGGSCAPGRHPPAGIGGCRDRARIDPLAESHWTVVAGDDPPFALLPEDLALEPVELSLPPGYLLLQAPHLPGQPDPLGD